MSQVTIIERGAADRIASELIRLGLSRVLLVTGHQSYQSSGAKSILEPQLCSFSVQRFDGYSLNPTVEDALNGVNYFRQGQCDCIVAIGGGGAIDVAKAINVFQAHNGDALRIVTGEVVITERLVPIIAVPTTAGTGSEATHFAAIYSGGIKYSLADTMLRPVVAILDPDLTDSLPPYVTACSGFDALCQAVESAWSVGSTVDSTDHALEAINILVKNLDLAVNNPSRINREKMLRAANLAGRAIDISKTTAPHALSYRMTIDFGIPHGHAVAITLGRFFVLNQEFAIREDDDIVKKKMQSIFEVLGVQGPEHACKFWYDLMKKCGLETKMRSFGIDDMDKRASIILGVNAERLGNHPVPLSTDDLRLVIEQCG